jgi:alpha-amylase/alpha-mannosidase (GH57 family)
MLQEPVLSVLFLWHQHQPFYKDPLSNRYELPWVRLHATKDYYDMVALLDEFPKIRLNFNLVPSLLQQLDDYGQNKAQDKFFSLSLKPAPDLTFDDRLFLLNNFFMANWATMIDTQPRYKELLDKRGRYAQGEDLVRAQNYFKEQDWRDLQTWFNLAWMDPYWTEHDPFIRGLREKGKNFTEEDKQGLMQTQLKICGWVADKHKELQDRGQIEITASPFYHPILPLLCDTDAAKVALPQMVLPRHRFIHPEDAATQVQKAIEDHQRRFGRPPRGMWPSEGSVSDAAAHVMMDAGIRWAATDEANLARSLGPQSFVREDLYEPYRFDKGGKTLNFFFRDHELSDAIGFVYTGWNSHDAVTDLIKRLEGIRLRLKEKNGTNARPHVVPIILDGENCWEYYKDDGLPFLRELYKALSDHPHLQTVLGSEYLEKHPPQKSIQHLWSGSWINANYAIWIGHPEDNQAWDLLHRTREFLTSYLQAHPDRAGSPEAKLAWEEIYIAEGSDWCWWYGEDHSSANDEAFDYLFRKHLMNVYAAIGAKIPDDLRTPIKPKRAKASAKPPIDFITPKIDGKVTSYYEWQAAGVYMTDAGETGTMHRSQNILKGIYYGYDLHNLYFRLDTSKPLAEVDLTGYTFKISFNKPEGCEAIVKSAGGQLELQFLRKDQSPSIIPVASLAVQKVIEIALPLNLFPGLKPDFDWVLLVEKEGQELERWPTDMTLSHAYPSEENFAQSWTL